VEDRIIRNLTSAIFFEMNGYSRSDEERKAEKTMVRLHEGGFK